MVSYIRSDLDFILEQIKIAEAHAAFSGLRRAIRTASRCSVPGGSIPTYNLAWGLRTVDGTYNNLLHPEWGAADNEFPEPWARISGRSWWTRTAPAACRRCRSATAGRRQRRASDTAGPSDVFDPYVRTISNLLVDQTLGNPSAILTALQRAGIVAPGDQMAVTRYDHAAYEPLERRSSKAVGRSRNA